MITSAEFLARVESQQVRVGVIGLGYVGLPLAVEIAECGLDTVGYDVSPAAVAHVNSGRSHIQDVASKRVAALTEAGTLRATTEPTELATCDAISICVPTPLNKLKDPDLSYVVSASRAIRNVLRPGHLVVLESTTFPGTTSEVVLPILQESGLSVGVDFFLCYSPERVDPGNKTWHTKNTPKVLGGVTEACTRVGSALYDVVFDTVVPVSSVEAAELTKVYENTFRMINIALANELAQACEKLDVDVWEVIEAAATKPFGFMKFTPGPGLGGHCIPLDPHYLSWKMRTLAYRTRMIELASEINAEMPSFVVRQLADALNDEGKAVRGSRVLVLGIAYKPNIDDVRESPAIEVMRLLQKKGAIVHFHDPHALELRDDGHTPLDGLPMRSVALTPEALAVQDAVVLITDHAAIDYAMVSEHAVFVLDTRGRLREGTGPARIVGLSGQDQSVVDADNAESLA
ncbi:MAG: nucleotide sugar dehydrogenase [Bacteroidota bacterium]